jgi:hypothetical protein
MALAAATSATVAVMTVSPRVARSSQPSRLADDCRTSPGTGQEEHAAHCRSWLIQIKATRCARRVRRVSSLRCGPRRQVSHPLDEERVASAPFGTIGAHPGEASEHELARPVRAIGVAVPERQLAPTIEPPGGTTNCQIDRSQLSSAPMSAGEPYSTTACCGSATSIRNVGRVGYRQHPDRRGIERPDAADVCHLDPVMGGTTRCVPGMGAWVS